VQRRQPTAEAFAAAQQHQNASTPVHVTAP
jgi:hypothetical protein